MREPWRERTKEQVTRRNQRDRDLALLGWRVIHFSGSEFFRAPLNCIEQAWWIADDVVGRLIIEEWRREDAAAAVTASTPGAQDIATGSTPALPNTDGAGARDRERRCPVGIGERDRRPHPARRGRQAVQPFARNAPRRRGVRGRACAPARRKSPCGRPCATSRAATCPP